MNTYWEHPELSSSSRHCAGIRKVHGIFRPVESSEEIRRAPQRLSPPTITHWKLRWFRTASTSVSKPGGEI